MRNMEGDDRGTDPLTDEDSRRYAEVLREIKARVDSMGGLLERPLDFVRVDAAAVQIRKALEMVAYGSLVANRSQLEEVALAFKKSNAKQARKTVKRINPEYWPRPVTQEVRTPTADDPSKFHLHDVEEGYLREKDWGRAHGEMSDILHAKKPYDPSIDLEADAHKIESVRDRLVCLLDHYTVRLAGAEFLLIAGMQTEETGDVQVAVFRREAPPNRAQRRAKGRR